MEAKGTVEYFGKLGYRIIRLLSKQLIGSCGKEALFWNEDIIGDMNEKHLLLLLKTEELVNEFQTNLYLISYECITKNDEINLIKNLY